LRRFNTLFKDKKEKEDIYKRKEEGKPFLSSYLFLLPSHHPHGQTCSLGFSFIPC